jgi:Ca2+-binding RTX toxin-like protein
LVVCGTSRAGALEIIMGPGNDMVEVEERLPVPLTIELGAGSDKFIGNGESDTCYPGPTRRNRCIGGAGDDVCITGRRNSDCVGGPGDDYCRHRSGSDGCFGGAGRDVCVMGAGQDGCHGGPGNDRLYGGRAPDQLYGGPGWDFCDGGPGTGRSHQCEAGPRH